MQTSTPTRILWILTPASIRLNAIQHVGQLIALPFVSTVCDRYGRKPTLIASAFLLLVGIALQGAAQNGEQPREEAIENTV